MTTQSLLKRLKKGWLSSADAFREFGTLKLTTRVSELRKAGQKIVSRERKANGKKFNEYRLAR